MMRAVRHEAYVGLLLTNGTPDTSLVLIFVLVVSLVGYPRCSTACIVANTVAYFLLRFPGCATNTVVRTSALSTLHSRCRMYDVAYRGNLRSRLDTSSYLACATLVQCTYFLGSSYINHCEIRYMHVAYLYHTRRAYSSINFITEAL